MYYFSVSWLTFRTQNKNRFYDHANWRLIVIILLWQNAWSEAKTYSLCLKCTLWPSVIPPLPFSLLSSLLHIRSAPLLFPFFLLFSLPLSGLPSSPAFPPYLLLPTLSPSVLPPSIPPSLNIQAHLHNSGYIRAKIHFTNQTLSNTYFIQRI